MLQKQFGSEVSTETAGRMLKGQATGIIEDMVSKRQSHAGRLYQVAFSEAKPVNLNMPTGTNSTSFLQKLDQLEASAGRTLKSRVKGIRNWLKTVQDGTNLEELHNKVRVELSDLIQTERKPRVQHQLRVLLRNYLDPALDRASPKYLDARSLYRDQSGALSRQLEGMIGGITQTGEAGLESIPRRILTKGGPEALSAV